MADTTLQDVRAKYPQYDDLSDQQLADGLHQKFYSDMPREQFDAKIGLARTSPAGNWSNIGAESLDQAGIKPAGASQTEQQGGLLRNFAAGTVGAITSTLGMFAGPEGGEEMRALGREPMPPPPADTGERGLNRALGYVGLNPDAVTANTSLEKFARAAGYGAASAAAPELALAKGATLASRLLQVGRAGFTGAASGVGGETAQELAPDPLKPIAGVAGGLVGGVGAALATQAPRAIMTAGRGGMRTLGPVTESGAQRLAGERIASSATNPDQVRTALQDVRELVPGSQPTSFQLTGDLGLGSLERGVQTTYPAEFAERRAQQNSARVGQLERLQPNGSASDLSDYVRGQMSWLDRQTEQDVADATRVAQQRVEAMGGNQTAEHYGSHLRMAAQEAEDTARTRERALWKAVDPTGDLTIDAKPIQTAAQGIVDALSGSAKPPAGDEKMILDIARGYTPTVPFRDVGALRSWVSDAMRTEQRTSGQTQTYGRLTRLRGAIQDAINGAVEQKAQQAPDELYAGLSGFENDASYWRGNGATRRESVGTYDASGTGGISPIPGTESASQGRSGSAPGNSRIPQAPVARSQSLLQTIVSAGGIRVRDASGTITREGQEIANLLQGSSRRGLINNRGGLPPDEIRQMLQNQGWFGRSDRFGPTARAAGEHPGDDLQELYDLIDREARGEKVYHPEEQAPGQRYDPGQHEQFLADRAARVGVNRQHGWSLRDWQDAIDEREAMRSESALTFDPAARERLSAATQATRDRADTYGRGPVSQILAKAGRQDQYRLGDAGVPAKVFTPGASGAESVQAYRRAVGDPQALLTLQDYAASNLRQYAGSPDGTLNPAKVQAWAQKHEPALRAFPELLQRFSSASAASEAIGEAMASRRTALDAYQTGVFSKIVGVSNPDDVGRALGGILNSQNRVAQMRQLASTARRDPNAFAGLRKGIADYIQGRFVGNTEAATSGQGTLKSDAFQTFMKQSETALSSVFSPEEISSLKAIAADLQRSNRSLSAVKIPGQSNTAQDLAQLGKGQPSILRRLIVEGASAAGGWFTAGPAGTLAGWLGAKTVGALRDAGMKRVDDIVKAAMLDPQLARALLEKVPSKPDTGSASNLMQALRKATLTGAAIAATAGTAQSQVVPEKQSAAVRTPEIRNAFAVSTQNAFDRSSNFTDAPPWRNTKGVTNALAR